MSNVVDMWGWLEDAQAQIGDDGPNLHQLYHQFFSAYHARDTEGVYTHSREYERLAKQYDLPWLAVFGRHWRAQHRLNNLNEGATAVAEVVKTFELAHRPESIECPQTICSVQDLAIVYGNVDGPGHADETLAACKDAMDRINPSWSCWGCLSIETIDGLQHAKRHGEAVELLAETEVTLRSAGNMPAADYALRRLDQLLEAGLDEEAAVFDGGLVRSRYDSHSIDDWDIYEQHRARLLLRQGEVDEAVEILSNSANPVELPRFAFSWSSLVKELMAADAIANDDYHSSVQVQIAQNFRNGGAWRNAFNYGIDAGLAAANRGAIGSANRCREFCVEMMGNLYKPMDAPERMAELDAAIANAPDSISEFAPMDQRVAELEDQLAGGFDAEAFAEYTELLGVQGWSELAEAKLWSHLKAHPEDEDCAFGLMGALMASSDGSAKEQLLALADLVSEAQPTAAMWIRANRHAQLEEWDECGQECEKIVAAEPDVVNTRRLWAHATRAMGNYPGAAEISAKILELGDPLPEELPTPGDAGANQELFENIEIRKSDLWSAVINGSLAKSWAVVRTAGAELGMTFVADSGPIEEEWGHCLVSFTDEDGLRRPHQALRTGPATATVVQVSHRWTTQHFGEKVVFDPKPNNPPAAEISDDERPHDLFDYTVIASHKPSEAIGYTVEGALPDSDDNTVWPKLRDSLYEAGFPVWSYDAGQAVLRETGELKDVLLLSIATTNEKSPAELHAFLTETIAEWPHKSLAWPDLADAVGGDPVAHQERLAKMWDEDHCC